MKKLPSTWVLELNDPRRLAENERQLRLLRQFEREAIRAGVKVRPKEGK